MSQQNAAKRFRSVGEGGFAEGERFYGEEVQLATRNSGMPLEGLRYDITPVGMHYLLIHFDIPEVDTEKWRLEVGGLVSRPLSLSLDEIKKRPARSLAVTMECAGNGRALLSPRPTSVPWLLEAVGTAEWTGTPLAGILAEAGVSGDAAEIVFTGLDRGVQGEDVHFYQRSLSVREADRDDVLLAYHMNGGPLPPQHGFPLRLIVPGWYGMASVKWLDRIEVVGEEFGGFQVAHTYRYASSADDPGEPVTHMRVRSLMIPPGIPDFMTRNRLIDKGPVMLTGRAWAGGLGVSRVEVSVDGGSSWSEAELEDQVAAYAWRQWSYGWNAAPGRYMLCVRATDTDGSVQPLTQPWNFQGMGNNMVQRVDVLVE